MPGRAQFDSERVHSILDTLPDQAYADVVHLATQIFQAPMASVTLLDAQRVWRKAEKGLPAGPHSVSRQGTFAARVAMNAAAVTVIHDARQDAFLASHPYVIGEPAVRFFAGAPIVAADGVVVGTVVVMDTHLRTISEDLCTSLQCLARQLAMMLEVRQRAELEAGDVFRENQYLQALTLAGLDLQSVIDRNYRYRYVNQVYLDYWQKRRDQIEGHTVAELVGEGLFKNFVKTNIDRALAGESVTVDACIEYPVLGRRYVRNNHLPARDRHGNIIGTVMRIEDITDLKEVEMSLRHTVRLLEEKKLDLQRFIYILSHDLREPVNTILNFSDLLREQFAESGNEQVRRFLDFVYKGGDRMRSLLEDLLKYVRVDSNEPDSAPVSLEEVFQEVRQDLSAALERTQAVISCDPLPTVWGDRHLLRVLVQNLVENAIKFVAHGVKPCVRLSASTEMDSWELTVTDNGVGIREQQRELIFELFKRLHSRKQYEGTGLGLATCRRIAELHGGRIWVTPAPLQGSCFHVLLPRK